MIHFIEIQNLKCGGCAKTVIDSLQKMDSVTSVTVDIDKSIVSVEAVAEDQLTAIENKLSEIGYPPVGSKNSIITKAKSYVSCATGKMSS